MTMVREWAAIFTGPDSSWIWTMLQFFAIAVSLGFIHRQLRLLRQANMIHIAVRLDERWCSTLFLAQRNAVCGQYRIDRLSINHAEGAVLGFFEDLGVFLKRGIVDQELIWEKYSYYIEHYWLMYEPQIREFRNSQSDQTWFDHFEVLDQAMRKVARHRGVPYGKRARAELDRFVSGEVGVQAVRVAGDGSAPHPGPS